MAVTYDVTNNIITVTGGTVGAPNDFDDLYTADKAGTLSLHHRDGITAVDGAPVAVDRAERPADYKELGGACNDLYIVVENWANMTTATIQVVGEDRCGNAVTEDVVVTGNGTYNLSAKFAVIDTTQVTVFTKTDAGTFDYELIQGQWGVSYKGPLLGASIHQQFAFNAKLRIGDLIGTITWFADENVQVRIFGAFARYTKYIEVMNNGHFRLGDVKVLASKTTTGGVAYICDNAGGGGLPYYIFNNTGGEVKLYASLLAYGTYLAGGANGMTLWGCTVKPVNMGGSNWDIYDSVVGERTYPLSGLLGTIDNLLVYSSTHGWYKRWLSGDVTFTNLKIRDCTDVVFIRDWVSGNVYLVNPDVDVWAMAWNNAGTCKVYRQYEFDAKCIDLNGNPIQGVTALGEYISPYGTAFTDTTDAAGEISTQTVDHGFFDQAHGDTEQLKTPLKVTYSKPGWQTVVKHYTMDEKTKDVIKMTRVVDLIFVKPPMRVALNLDEDNPESEIYELI